MNPVLKSTNSKTQSHSGEEIELTELNETESASSVVRSGLRTARTKAPTPPASEG